jgi:hypothetical protein
VGDVIMGKPPFKMPDAGIGLAACSWVLTLEHAGATSQHSMAQKELSITVFFSFSQKNSTF